MVEFQGSLKESARAKGATVRNDAGGRKVGF
jgi:hypothetical protein